MQKPLVKDIFVKRKKEWKCEYEKIKKYVCKNKEKWKFVWEKMYVKRKKNKNVFWVRKNERKI